MHRNLFDLVNIRPEAIHMPAGTNMDAVPSAPTMMKSSSIWAAWICSAGLGHDGHIGFNEG